ncbi:MAG: peptidoglycan-binding protein [Pseudomonadota bacterium]
MFRSFLAAFALLVAGVAQADVAVIIANKDYPGRFDPRATLQALSVEEDLRDAGFETFVGENATANETAELLDEAFAEAGEDDTVIVFLAGLTVLAGDRVYLLAPERGELTRFQIERLGTNVAPILEAMAAFPGRALLLMGADAAPIEVGTVNRQGSRLITQGPSGIAIAQASTPSLVSDLGRLLSGDERTLQDAFGLAVYGDVALDEPFLPGAAPDTSVDAEDIYWELTQDLGTKEAYEAYIRRYPTGRYVIEARQAIRDLEPAPEPTAEEIEAALGLDRAARRDIQRDLAVLEFYRQAIDGLFGPGTRGAIRSWQASRGLEATSFLTGNQIVTLARQAEQRREDERRADRLYWAQVGQGGTEEGLRAYLQRYPQGEFAEQARRELAAIEAARRAEAEREEMRVWRAARNADTIPAYREYIRLYPNGRFVQEARQRIRQLRGGQTGPTGPTQDQINADRQEEARVLENPIIRLLAERQLAALGFNPGPIDGRFTQETRRAVGAFQESQNLPPTGFVGRATGAALLASLR